MFVSYKLLQCPKPGSLASKEKLSVLMIDDMRILTNGRFKELQFIKAFICHNVFRCRLNQMLKNKQSNVRSILC